MSALPSLSGVQTAVVPAPAPAQPRARGFLHIVRYGAGPGSVYILTYHRLDRTASDGVVLSEAKDPSSADRAANGAHPHARPTNGNGSSTAGVIRSSVNREESTGVILSGAKDLSSSGAAEPARPKPVLAESAQALIDLLERLGVDFHRSEVRGAMEDILRLGSANIPDLWLSDDDLLARGLAES
jgi:hypothetical protein